MENALFALRALYHDFADEALQDFSTFLKFESISSEIDKKEEVTRCAFWLKKTIEEMGFATSLWKTSSHPILFASHLEAGPEKPTLLIYNHYDVQPVDPLELWDSPPFEPTIRNGEIFARGAQDNKGQCFYVLQGLKLLLKKNKTLPINVKLLIEGEEEMGSIGLSRILEKKKAELQADYLGVVDLGMLEAKQPVITLGVRGIVTIDVDVTAAHTDLHSGSHGGIAPNANHAMIEILSKLHFDSGAVAVPGFYDAVRQIPQSEKEQLSLTFDSDKYQRQFGTPPSGGEKALSPLERAWLRPTLEINGMSGGYSGTGFKTVIPARAHAKISCRLVPDQNPQTIGRLVADYITFLAPEEVNIIAKIHPGGGKAVRTTVTSPIVRAFSKAYEEVFGQKTGYIFEGASIPIVYELAKKTEAAFVLLGLGLPDDNIHAPNEHFGIDRLEKGSLIIARAIELLATSEKGFSHEPKV